MQPPTPACACKACSFDRHRAAHAPDAWVSQRQALLVLRGIPDCVHKHLGGQTEQHTCAHRRAMQYRSPSTSRKVQGCAAHTTTTAGSSARCAEVHSSVFDERRLRST